MSRNSWSAILGVLLWVGPAAAGELVVIGGALEPDHEGIYRRILDAALPDRPICILPTASSEPENSMNSYLADFQRYGGEKAAVGRLITQEDRRKAENEGVGRALKSCGGFFFTGGDQSRIVELFRPEGRDTPVAAALRQVLAEGGVVAGTSAGAAMMSDPMIGGGSSEKALEHGVVERDGEPGVWVRSGMGFLPGALVDQHFLERGRVGRLLVATAQQKHRLGLGISENTALAVRGLGTDEFVGEVIGPSGVLVADLGPATPGGVVGARLWLLGDGDRFEFSPRSTRSRVVVPASTKIPVVAEGKATKDQNIRSPRRLWRDGAFHGWLMRLATSERASAEAGRSGPRIRLRKDEGFRALVDPERTKNLFAGPFVVEALDPKDERDTTTPEDEP